MIDKQDATNLLDYWRIRAQRSKIAHYMAADHFANRHKFFGVPVVVLTAFVGTTVFATLKERPEVWLQIIIGLIIILSAVLASLQTFFNYSDRASKHGTAAAKYGSIQREIEEIRLFRPEDSETLQSTVSRIRRRMDELAECTIDTPQDIWEKADREVLKLNPGGMISPNKSLELTS
jgi:hypothetical protein